MPDVVAGFVADTIAGLPCRISLPAAYRPDRRYPLVVSLHGSFERGVDNQAQLKNGLSRLRQRTMAGPQAAIIVAPQLPPGATFGGAWYGGHSPAQEQVVALVRELCGRRTVNPEHVVGVGFSMGAIGLWDMLVRFPGTFHRAVCIAGDLTPEVARACVSLSVTAIHGADDEVVSVAATSHFQRLVGETPSSPARVQILPGYGHDVWRPAFDDDGLWRWALQSG